MPCYAIGKGVNMFQLKPVTPRVKKLRDKYRDTIPAIDAERTRIVTDYYKKSKNVHPAVRRATALYEILSKMTVRVEDDELIVGNLGKYFHTCAYAVEYNGLDWVADELNSASLTKRSPPTAWPTWTTRTARTSATRRISRTGAKTT
jgi:formate C-acetyltransferase